MGDPREVAARVERSMLFVPGTRWETIVKAARSEADAVCVDLEDSVTPEKKGEARANAVRALRELDFGGKTRIVRVNPTDAAFTYRDVVDVVEAAGDRLDLLMLPKAESPNDVIFVDTLLAQIERQRGLPRRIGLEVQMESAAGFVWLREIAAASPRVEALVFGPGDYAASLHMPSSNVGAVDADDALYPGHRWHVAMHALVAVGRAFGLRCIDGPFAAYQDLSGAERACRIARALGFDGKQCIHPAQIEVCHRVFAPTDDEVAHARRVVAAADAAAAEGRGASSVDGAMVDAASVRLARVVLERHARSGSAVGSEPR